MYLKTSTSIRADEVAFLSHYMRISVLLINLISTAKFSAPMFQDISSCIECGSEDKWSKSHVPQERIKKNGAFYT